MKTITRNTLLSLLVFVPFIQSAFAFNCGPHANTYLVTGYADRAMHKGIRCVFIGTSTDSNIPILSWYGEGRRGQYKYRHVGQAIMDNGKIKAYSADIFGNGENYNHLYPGTITMNPVGHYSNASAIFVGGAWSEVWVKVTNVNYTPLAAPEVCGTNFRTYYVNEDNGSGIRCVLRPWTIMHTTPMVWYGTGKWNGKRYSHLGMFGDPGHGAIDLCGGNFGQFCGSFPQGSIIINSVNSNFQLSGAWDELWEQ